jgi:hypothetical protein
MINGPDTIARIRKQFGVYLAAEKPIGIVSSFSTVRKELTANPSIINIVGWATTDAVDSVGDVVLPEGLDWKTYFLRNGGQMFVDHQYTVTDRVGWARDTMKLAKTPAGGRGWLIRGEVRIDEMNPKARAVIAGAEDGGIGLSIAFEATDYSQPTPEEKTLYPNAKAIVRKGRVIEVSYTFMPCNVECQTQAVTMDEGKALQLAGVIAKSKGRETIEKWMQVPTRKPTIVVIL